MKINVKNYRFLAIFCMIALGAFQPASANPNCISRIGNSSDQTWTFWFERTGGGGPLDYDVKIKQNLNRTYEYIPCTRKTPCSVEGHGRVEISYLMWEDKMKKSDLVPVRVVFVDRKGDSKYWESTLTGFFQGVNMCHKFIQQDFNGLNAILVNSPGNGDFEIRAEDYSTKIPGSFQWSIHSHNAK
jgi:hypothetical protein